MTSDAVPLAAVTGLDVSTRDELIVLGLVLLATLLGAALGAEREVANKSAGIRTHALVATGAALVVAVGDLVIHVDGGAGDTTRTLHGVITGLGFLGAGAIIRHNDATIEGLTTAASLWFAGAVGATVGMGLPVLAVGATVIGLVMLRLVGTVEARWRRPGSVAGRDAGPDPGPGPGPDPGRG